MEAIHKIASRTSHLSLSGTPVPGAEPAIPHSAEGDETVPDLSPTVSAALEEIYKALIADPASKADFLHKVQGEEPEQPPATAEDGSAIQEATDHLASLDAFKSYMASPASAALRPADKQLLSAPITDYFISSSHNTYLTGNQLYSDAAADAYKNVLLGGCRCVEIDVWDGEPHSESEDEGTSSSSDSSSSESSSDEEKKTTKTKTKKPRKSEAEKQEAKKAKAATTTTTTRRSRINHAVSSKLDGMLHRKSEPAEPATATQPTAHDVSNDCAEPAVEGAAAVRVPSRPEPMVLHGHTLTKGATFRDVCNAIRDNAFVTSDLPVIVSLEVHACLEQQQIMVEIMQEAWKGLLINITPELLDSPRMPTPEDLKRKILIKVKWVPHLSEDHAEAETADELKSLEASHNKKNTAKDGSSGIAPPKPSKILEALSRLAVYTKGFSFKGMHQPEAKVPGHVFSLSESAAKETHEQFREELFEHNRKYFMRVYPYGLRVNSSNYDPSFHWRRGAQIVALNWQNLDMGTMLNHGMFRGEPGWVLKPQGYRSTEDPFKVPITRCKLELSIEFFAGQHLSLPPGDTKEKKFHPYVSCSLHVEQPGEEIQAVSANDDSTDGEPTSYKRTIKSSAGISPDFKQQTIQFPPVTGIVEELSFVRFKIKDDEIGPDAMAAWTCIRLDRLRSGYRLLHFHDCTGWKTGGEVLVKITKNVS